MLPTEEEAFFTYCFFGGGVHPQTEDPGKKIWKKKYVWAQTWGLLKSGIRCWGTESHTLLLALVAYAWEHESRSRLGRFLSGVAQIEGFELAVHAIGFFRGCTWTVLDLRRRLGCSVGRKILGVILGNFFHRVVLTLIHISRAVLAGRGPPRARTNRHP